MADRLQEAKDLLAATEGHTPGPWAQGLYRSGQGIPRPADTRHFQGPADVLCQWTDGEDAGWRVLAQQNCNFRDDPGYEETGRLLAAAPQLRELLTAMVAEVEALRKRIDLHEKLSYSTNTMIAEWTDGIREIYEATSVLPTVTQLFEYSIAKTQFDLDKLEAVSAAAEILRRVQQS